MALGLAYHYFPSKEAIVADYYQSIQTAYRERVLQGLSRAKTLRERLALAFHPHMELICQDQKVLGGVLKFVGETKHPLSLLGLGTAAIQVQSVQTYRLALEGQLPKDLMDLAPQFLWTLHMGFILYFLYDESPDQHKTRVLIYRSLELVTQFFLHSSPVLQPFARPICERIGGILQKADLTIGKR